MAARRRDPARAGYSSADAYRSAPSSNSHGNTGSSSSEEEAHLTSPFTPDYTTAITGATQSSTRERPRSEITDDEERPLEPARRVDGRSLSPPKPFFTRGPSGDRRSWSSAASFEHEISDSDAPSGMAGVGTGHPSRSATQPLPAPTSRVRSRNHHRRRSSMANEYAVESTGAEIVSSPVSTAADPFVTPGGTPTSSMYGAPAAALATAAARGAPPSAYPFPFQSHPGNPDPGTHIPGVGRRSSLDSLNARSPVTAGTAYSAGGNAAGYGLVRNEETDIADDLARPYAPFMSGTNGPREGSVSPGPASSQNQLYRNSAAGAMSGDQGHTLPRIASNQAINMRAPFLSPASRPTSSVWSPPSYPYPYPPSGGNAGSAAFGYPNSSSLLALTKKSRPTMPSSRLTEKLTAEDKPWIKEKDTRGRISWWLTVAMMFLGVAGAAVLCYFGWTDVRLLSDSDLCQVMDEDFSEGLDLNTWSRDVELGGFGNGEFQMTTANSKNSFTQNGQLYILPTLTADEIGSAQVYNGYTYPLAGCTSQNASACSATSNSNQSIVINPVQSARLNTLNSSKSIRYGRVEVVAKLPRGDWLWPAVWMLPVNSDNGVPKYGPWPLSGEIDIMEARGNGPSYPAQGTNFVRSSLNYGVLATLQTQIFGWWDQKRSSYDKDFHLYGFEWTPDWMRFYVDNRLQAMINLKITGSGGHSFFERGHYPLVAHNDSETETVIDNIWEAQGGGPSAPFDQPFYLIINLAVGGTSGWFPDNVGGKPWFDGSGPEAAMFDFAQPDNMATWLATWPTDQDDLAFRIDSVKMWQLGSCSSS